MNPSTNDSTASEVLFVNGRIFSASSPTVAGILSYLECMMVKDGVIEHIGTKDDDFTARAKRNGVLTHDLNGQTVLPGFIDGHMHLLLLGQSLEKVDLEACKSLEDIRIAISTYAKSQPSVSRILCRGWMHSMTNGDAFAHMLNGIDERPIFIDSKDLHSTWCNDAALAELGVETLPDPPGGVIHRDPAGRPSGLLSEAANLTLVWPHLAKVAEMHEKLEALKAAITVYSNSGYTGMIEMAMDENAWEAIQVLRSRETLPIRIAAHWLIKPSANDEANLAQVDRAILINKQFNINNSPDCYVTGIKIICDGVIDACTAALCEPYSNGVSADPLWTAEMLAPVVRRADEAGLQCALHAIGDYAIKLAIDALEKNCNPGRRHRIEHLELASPEDAQRLGRLGITASIQPVHADPAILRAWPKLLGERRCDRAFAYQEFLDGGAPLAIGTDSPTAPHLPLPNLHIATTRSSAKEPEMQTIMNKHFALTLCDAIAAATSGAAYSCFADKLTGSLKPGLSADFVVLKPDWEPMKLLQAKICQTWYKGKKVYDLMS